MKKTLMAALVLGFGLAGAVDAQAKQAAQDPTDAAIACLEITVSADRLSCLEAATRQIAATRIRNETAEEGEATRTSPGVVLDEKNMTPEEAFGAEGLDRKKQRKAKEKEPQIREVESPIIEFTFNPLGVATIALANGQVWTQLSGDSEKIKIIDTKRLYTATVKRAAFGSYRLKVNEIDRLVRVRRIK